MTVEHFYPFLSGWLLGTLYLLHSVFWVITNVSKQPFQSRTDVAKRELENIIWRNVIVVPIILGIIIHVCWWGLYYAMSF